MTLRNWLGRDKQAEKAATQHYQMSEKERKQLQQRLRLLQVEVNVIIREGDNAVQ